MLDFLKELEKYKGYSLKRYDGNRLIFQHLSRGKRMKVMVYEECTNTYYIVGYITNEEKLKEGFLV